MSIQSSINQAINLGGLLYTQTGKYKAKQEDIAEKQQASKAVELAEQASKTARATTGKAIDPKASQAAKDIAAEAQRDKAEAYKRLFKLDPTEQNLGKAIAAGDVANVMQGVADKKYKIETIKVKSINCIGLQNTQRLFQKVLIIKLLKKEV